MTKSLLNCLIEGLEQRGIAYCHWKSNFSLSQNPEQQEDFDFLIDRQAMPATTKLLLELGCKPTLVKWGANPPGIYHYYGLDRATGELIHLHLFSSVLTGESLIKSHRLPFEEMLLENHGRIAQFRTTSKDAELLLFIVRTFIKAGSLPDLYYLLRKPSAVQEELRWLQDGNNFEETLRLRQRYCPALDEDLFRRCIATLEKPLSLWSLAQVAGPVRRRLRIYAKYSALGRLAAYTQLAAQFAMRYLTGARKNKVLQTGGGVIAFVGPEATGKSTLVRETKAWLGSTFTVQAVHVGKPPANWLTAPINGLLPLGRKLLPHLRMSRVTGHVVEAAQVNDDPTAKGTSSLLYALRAVAVAWDRRRLLQKVRRAAANGAIVICDRYPSETVGAMDSARLQPDPTKRGIKANLFRRLAKLEERLYQQMPPPDVVLRLSVSVETAKERNRTRIKLGKEADAYIESRHRQVREWRKAGAIHIHEIDTNQSLPETIQRVKEAIWVSL